MNLLQCYMRSAMQKSKCYGFFSPESTTVFARDGAYLKIKFDSKTGRLWFGWDVWNRLVENEFEQWWKGNWQEVIDSDLVGWANPSDCENFRCICKINDSSQTDHVIIIDSVFEM